MNEFCDIKSAITEEYLSGSINFENEGIFIVCQKISKLIGFHDMRRAAWRQAIAWALR